MHYFRHILLSAMAEFGTTSTILSASLEHTNLNTLYQFYLNANHKKTSQITNQNIEKRYSLETTYIEIVCNLNVPSIFVAFSNFTCSKP